MAALTVSGDIRKMNTCQNKLTVYFLLAVPYKNRDKGLYPGSHCSTYKLPKFNLIKTFMTFCYNACTKIHLRLEA